MLLMELKELVSKCQRIKTDSKLIRAAPIASKALNDEFDLMEIAEKVVREDGRTFEQIIENEERAIGSIV